MKVRIEITKGPDAGRQIVVNPNDKIIVGRDDDADVCMVDSLISRAHCEIRFDGKRILIRDLGSTNHTFVQQNLTQPITPNEYYEVANASSFFVGPESRFTVTFLAEPAVRPVDTHPLNDSAGGNFTSTIAQSRPSRDLNDSSISNLLGAYSPQPGLSDLNQPPAPRHPPVQQPDLDSPMPAGYQGSIAPPHLQGTDEAIRPQVGDDAFVDDSYLKSTPNVESNSPIELQSINPPEQTPPTAVPPAAADSEDSSIFSASIVGQQSIAAPGLAYPNRPPTPVDATIPPTPVAPVGADTPSPLDSDINVPVHGIDSPVVNDEPHHRQPNGLYFHTGDDLAALPKLIAELTANFQPVYCLDATRLELADASEPEEDANAGPFEDSATAPSAFDLDDDDELIPGESNDDAPKLVGVPVFDFLPEGMKHNGPMLQSPDEFDIPLESAWHNDAVMVFFGEDPQAVRAHLQALVHINIQNGKTFKGMFGFCWPTVLHSTFEGQAKTQVDRVFGDCISCVLLEDPQQRFAWNLVAKTDLSGTIPSLKQANSAIS